MRSSSSGSSSSACGARSLPSLILLVLVIVLKLFFFLALDIDPYLFPGCIDECSLFRIKVNGSLALVLFGYVFVLGSHGRTG